jgi:hypothetical protein
VFRFGQRIIREMAVPSSFLNASSARLSHAGRSVSSMLLAAQPSIGSPTPSPQLSGFRIEREKRFNVARSTPSKPYHRTVVIGGIGFVVSLMNFTPGS